MATLNEHTSVLAVIFEWYFQRKWHEFYLYRPLFQRTNVNNATTTKCRWQICPQHRPPICNLKKIRMAWQKNSADIRISRIIAYTKYPARIRLNTKILRLKSSWLQTILTEVLNLNWNDCQHKWLLSVSLTSQNLHPSIITRTFEIKRMIHFK